MAGFVAETWKDIKGNAKWDLIKWLFGGSVIATAVALVRAASLYWRMQILIFVLSVLGFAAISFYQRAQAHKRTREALVDKEPEKLVIHSAVYGTGPTDDVLVTNKLRTAVRDALVIPVDNNLVPRDPAIGKHKRLAVEYSYGNPSIQQASRPEGERLVLPEDSAIHRLRDEVEQLTRQMKSLDARGSAIERTPLQIAREQTFNESYNKLTKASREVIDQVSLGSINMSQVSTRLDREGFSEPNKVIQAALDSGLVQRDFVGYLSIASEMKEAAERHISEATKPDSSLRGRTIAKCDELKAFLKEYGPEPEMQHNFGTTDHDAIGQYMKTVLPWRQKLQADFRLRFAKPLASISDEIQVVTGVGDTLLSNAIATAANSPNGEIKAIDQIIERLWGIASKLDS